MLRIVRASCLAALFLVSLSACVNTVQGSRGLVDSDRSGLWYVVRHAKDGRNLAGTIAATLHERGLAAASGYAEDQPDTATKTVHYTDNWRWDMRMYLMKLRVEARDPGTGRILAWGESHQSSLAATGKTHEDVVDRAVGALLGDSDG